MPKKFPGIEKKYDLFPGNFLREINEFDYIYVPFSAGYHSTTSVLKLHDLGYKNVFLLHNKTYLETRYVLDLIQEIVFKTDYPISFIEPNKHGLRIGQIIRKSMEQIPQIIQDFRENKHNYRDHIICCKYLKKSSSRKWYTKNLLDKSKSVIISSLCPYESYNRNMRLTELRKKNTYIRLHQKFGNVYYAYPFRDIYSVRPFHNYLISKGIFPEHSGCVICPIREAYDIWKGLK